MVLDAFLVGLKVTGCFCSYLINGLLDLWFLSFSTSKDEVSSQCANNLQLLPQTVCLCFDGLRTQKGHRQLS